MIRRMTTAAALMGLATAGCDGDPVGAPDISPEDVAGIYSVCSLHFDPDGDLLHEVDILEAGFESENPDVREPQLQADASGDFEMVFTPKGQFVERRLFGRFTITDSRVSLSFTGGTTTASSFLLPPVLDLAFQATPKSLTTAATTEYLVARSDYARLANVSESGLADQIPGRLLVVFQARSVGCG